MTKGKWPNGLRDALAAMPEMSQAELARKVGTSRQNIQRWLNGERELTRDTALILAPILETTAAALMLLPDENAPARKSAELVEMQTLSVKLPADELDLAIEALMQRRAALSRKEAPPAQQGKRKATLK